jgi:hypothetical protein
MDYGFIGVAQTSISISAQLLVLINSYLSQPVIGGMPATYLAQATSNLASEVTGNYSSGGVRIEATQYKVEYSSDISEQLIVNVTNGTKSYLTDSIAPRPRSWRITGYISGDLSTDVLANAANMLNSFYPYAAVSTSLGALQLASNLSHIKTESSSSFMPSLLAKQRYLTDLFFSRQPFLFKTRDNETISNAVMSEMSIERTPAAQNKLGIQVVIHELNMLTAFYDLSIPTAAQSNNLGADSGGQVSLGATTSFPSSSPVNVPGGSVS